jgi:hypothetical protein
MPHFEALGEKNVLVMDLEKTETRDDCAAEPTAV